MVDLHKDEPIMQHPHIRAIEQRAITLYRAKYPAAPPWRELHAATRTMWVDYIATHPSEKGDEHAD